MGKNVNNFSYGNYENENTNTTSNFTKNNFNFEIKTPVKKQDKILKHEKDGTSVNLSDIADDIVNALENDDDNIKTHVDDLNKYIAFNQLNIKADDVFTGSLMLASLDNIVAVIIHLQIL